MTTEERLEQAEKLLKSVAADITGMESPQTITVDGDEETLLGGFSAGTMDYGPEGDVWLVSWPNLLIMRDKIEEFLRKEESGG